MRDLCAKEQETAVADWSRKEIYRRILGSSEDGWKRSLDLHAQRVQPVTTRTELMGGGSRVAAGTHRHLESLTPLSLDAGCQLLEPLSLLPHESTFLYSCSYPGSMACFVCFFESTAPSRCTWLVEQEYGVSDLATRLLTWIGVLQTQDGGSDGGNAKSTYKKYTYMCK